MVVVSHKQRWLQRGRNGDGFGWNVLEAVFVACIAIAFAGCQPGETESTLIAAVPDIEPADERRQLARTCDRGILDDCLLLVGLLGVGDGVPGNSDGVSLLERTCLERDHAPSCDRLADLWDPLNKGAQAPFSDTDQAHAMRARELWDLACTLGAPDACPNTAAHVERMAQAEAAFAEEQRLAREEAERLERERLARERAARERSSLVSLARRGVSGHCNRIEVVFGVEYAICETLIEAIANGRTSSRGRSEVQSYLRARGVSRLYGYIVARVERGLYEVVRRSYDSYWDISYPRGQHFLLRTELTDYTTQGRFSMWVQQTGQVPITTTNGFQQTWPVYSESVLGQAWQGVRDARAGDETSRAASSLLLALMGEL